MILGLIDVICRFSRNKYKFSQRNNELLVSLICQQAINIGFGGGMYFYEDINDTFAWRGTDYRIFKFDIVNQEANVTGNIIKPYKW